MEVVGPTGHRVVLRATGGLTYPGFGIVAPRRQFDERLRQAALAAGAEGFTGRAGEPRLGADGQIEGFRLDGGDADGTELRADVIIGADGALSRVGAVAGMVNDRSVLWGFAVRGYLSGPPPVAQILFWEPARWAGYPGYGWLFPGPDGTANIGLGVGIKGDRKPGARASRDLDDFITSQRPGHEALQGKLGGWLKMGMVGTNPAKGRTLLVGDAAGLVNSLQGEGIAQALGSGRAAAAAILVGGPSGAADRYRAEVAALYAPYAASTAAVTSRVLGHPRLVAGIGRVLTAPGVGRLVAGGWSVYWNDLLDGAIPGRPRKAAAVADFVVRTATRPLNDHRSVWASVGGPPPKHRRPRPHTDEAVPVSAPHTG